ncbi:hypothetical protein BUALT_Bualt06G0028600 [Buddleja alternifolia]|uniref:C2H2-type domain-containing protein n=1 Tax=Buddleja alternifolia TaxID=168488 RepID=A0AAV6XDJ8_9LAMI|nr:hypothetical protein BUALT_Bualt06G0028600 [Buddleja alternifolia]
MEAVEAVPPPAGQNNNNNNNNKDLSPIAKGKRTKRHRPHSPISFTITTPTDNNHLHRSPSFSAASSEESTTTAEVDTARCLILLSRGHFPNHPPNDHHHQYYSKHNNSSKRYIETTKSCVYACKTCSRVFPSFQALGGHRASHKKPKNDKKPAIFSDDDDFPSPSMSSSKNRFSSNSLSLQLSNISTTTFSATPKSSPSPRIHECSYCGAEFTSGQALGGHMRKHRGGPINRTTSFPPEASIEEPEHEESKRPRNGLCLDLNLPAPEDENQKFGFTSRPQEKSRAEEKDGGHVLSTTTPPLVDCRY